MENSKSDIETLERELSKIRKRKEKVGKLENNWNLLKKTHEIEYKNEVKGDRNSQKVTFSSKDLKVLESNKNLRKKVNILIKDLRESSDVEKMHNINSMNRRLILRNDLIQKELIDLRSKTDPYTLERAKERENTKHLKVIDSQKSEISTLNNSIFDLKIENRKLKQEVSKLKTKVRKLVKEDIKHIKVRDRLKEENIALNKIIEDLEVK